MKTTVKKIDAYKNPIWNKYRCDNGNQWVAVKGGGCDSPDGSFCYFSGCKENDHKIHIVGETSNREEVYAWPNF